MVKRGLSAPGVALAAVLALAVASAPALRAQPRPEAAAGAAAPVDESVGVAGPPAEAATAPADQPSPAAAPADSPAGSPEEPAPATATAQPAAPVVPSADALAAAPLKAIKGAVKADVQALRRGPLLIHGNYCGIGNRPGTAPVDALDAACRRHDACTHANRLPNCACDDRLRHEATAIAEASDTPAELKALASATAAAMVVLICK